MLEEEAHIPSEWSWWSSDCLVSFAYFLHQYLQVPPFHNLSGCDWPPMSVGGTSLYMLMYTRFGAIIEHFVRWCVREEVKGFSVVLYQKVFLQHTTKCSWEEDFPFSTHWKNSMELVIWIKWEYWKSELLLLCLPSFCLWNFFAFIWKNRQKEIEEGEKITKPKALIKYYMWQSRQATSEERRYLWQNDIESFQGSLLCSRWRNPLCVQ